MQNLNVAREQLRLIDARLGELREAYESAVAANQAGLVLPDRSPARVPSRVEIDRLEERRRTYDEVRRMLESILAEPVQGIQYPAVTRRAVRV
jgi:hypothetical protein